MRLCRLQELSDAQTEVDEDAEQEQGSSDSKPDFSSIPVQLQQHVVEVRLQAGRTGAAKLPGLRRLLKQKVHLSIRVKGCCIRPLTASFSAKAHCTLQVAAKPQLVGLLRQQAAAAKGAMKLLVFLSSCDSVDLHHHLPIKSHTWHVLAHHLMLAGGSQAAAGCAGGSAQAAGGSC